MAKDAIRMTGKVIKAHNKDEFDVELENGLIIQSHISGKMRVHHITILRGDTVDIEMSTYDMTKGRIVFRHK